MCAIADVLIAGSLVLWLVRPAHCAYSIPIKWAKLTLFLSYLRQKRQKTHSEFSKTDELLDRISRRAYIDVLASSYGGAHHQYTFPVTIQTGMLTAMCAITSLVLFLASVSPSPHLSVYMRGSSTSSSRRTCLGRTSWLTTRCPSYTRTHSCRA